jgi:uncharacterized protein (TIGR03382 family)
MATQCRTSGLLATLAAVLILAPAARAHVRLVLPASRYGDEMKSRPCGRPGGVRTTRVTTVRPGQTITVVFDEIIDHPGYFRIAFDRTGDAALGPPVWNGAAFVNPSNVEVLVDLIGDPPGLTHGEIRVQLPDIECDTCTLQLIQVMTDKPPFDGIDDFYYQCADLRLSTTAALGGPPPLPASPIATTSQAGTPSGGCSSGGSSWIALGALLAARLARRRKEGRAPAA